VLFGWLVAVVGVCVCVSPEGKNTFGTPEELFTHSWQSVPRNLRKSVFDKLNSDPTFQAMSDTSCGPSTQTPTTPLVEHKGAVYSQKLNTGGMNCANAEMSSIDVARFGVVKSFPYIVGCTTYRDLLASVQDAFKEPKLELLWTREGNPIFLDDSVHPLPKANYKQFLIATKTLRSPHYDYTEEERFFYPTIEVGETVPVRLPDLTGEIRQLNLTTLSIHPKIFLIENFISEEENEAILHHIFNLPASSKLQWTKSTVGVDHGSAADGGSYRVSSTLWLGDMHDNSDFTTKKVHSRGQALLKHPVELMEPFQVVRYPPTGHYYFHTDSFDLSDRRSGNPYVSGGGNRYATLILYLSASSAGGYTAFPLAGDTDITNPHVDPKVGCDPNKAFVVTPKKGAAVLFYDVLEDKHMEGYPDIRSTHAGCDTEGAGEKIIMNQWFRNKRVKVNGKWHMYDNNW